MQIIMQTIERNSKCSNNMQVNNTSKENIAQKTMNRSRAISGRKNNPTWTDPAENSHTMHAADDIYELDGIKKKKIMHMSWWAVQPLFKYMFIRTTSSIRIMPVGVLSGRRSQCNGTPHGVDGIWMAFAK